MKQIDFLALARDVQEQAPEPKPPEAMPSPVTGYLKIPNKAMDALIAADFTRNQMRIVLWVIRNTVGWQRGSITARVVDVAWSLGLEPSHTGKDLKILASPSGPLQITKIKRQNHWSLNPSWWIRGK